jgi:peptide-methionine (S)-S-oxide reductase
MPCHSHATPLHQAALDGRIDLMELLVAHGARLDTPDKLWRGTPLGWSMHEGRKEAEAWLRARSGQG